MDKKMNVVIAVVAVVVIALGAVLFLRNGNDNSNGNNTSDGSELADSEIAATLTYTNDGFKPAGASVPAGSAVRIVNESDDTIAPSSDNHPEHTLNPELNYPDIKPGESATMVLSETGTWGLHNHYKDDHRATIIVK